MTWKNLFIGLASLLAATPVAALDCDLMWDRLVLSAKSRGYDISSSEGFQQIPNGCRAADVALDTGRTGRMLADQISLTGTHLDRFAQFSVPPSELELEITALRFVPTIPDDVFQYLLETQQAQSSTQLILKANWDAVRTTYQIEQFSLDLDGENAINWSAEISGVDISTVDAFFGSIATAALTRSVLQITSTELFERYALLPLGQSLLNNQSPIPEQVRQSKIEANAQVSALPDALFPENSKQALRDVIDAIPHPDGVLTLGMAANPGLSVGRFLQLSQNQDLDRISTVWDLLDGVTFDIPFVPFPAP